MVPPGRPAARLRGVLTQDPALDPAHDRIVRLAACAGAAHDVDQPEQADRGVETVISAPSAAETGAELGAQLRAPERRSPAAPNPAGGALALRAAWLPLPPWPRNDRPRWP